MRAGERAALVAEELALDELARDGRAVDLDERVVRRAGERRWMARAMSSLPVPLSPVMSTDALVGATFSISWKMRCIGGAAADHLVALELLLGDAGELAGAPSRRRARCAR